MSGKSIEGASPIKRCDTGFMMFSIAELRAVSEGPNGRSGLGYQWGRTGAKGLAMFSTLVLVFASKVGELKRLLLRDRDDVALSRWCALHQFDGPSVFVQDLFQKTRGNVPMMTVIGNNRYCAFVVAG